MISRWVGRPVVTLGTDGFGRSEDRVALRDFFEVDAKHIAAATLSALHRAGRDRREDDRDAGLQGSHINPDKSGSGDLVTETGLVDPGTIRRMATKSNCPSWAKTSKRATSSACS